MKKFLRITSTAILVSLIFTGCEKIKHETDFEFESTFNADLDCVVPAGSREINGNFNASAEIDLNSDPNVNKYLDKIKGYEILSIQGTITAISKDVTLTTATLDYSFDELDTSWTITNLPITLGTSCYEIVRPVQGDTIPMWTPQIIVSTTGTSDKDDVAFTIEVAIKTKFVADPL